MGAVLEHYLAPLTHVLRGAGLGRLVMRAVQEHISRFTLNALNPRPQTLDP